MQLISGMRRKRSSPRMLEEKEQQVQKACGRHPEHNRDIGSLGLNLLTQEAHGVFYVLGFAF